MKHIMRIVYRQTIKRNETRENALCGFEENNYEPVVIIKRLDNLMHVRIC